MCASCSNLSSNLVFVSVVSVSGFLCTGCMTIKLYGFIFIRMEFVSKVDIFNKNALLL